MNLSFIVTTYDIAAYIEQCLDSLGPCVRPGDEVIVVDDGSSDRTDLILERRMAEGFGPGIVTRLIALGTNTMGGVGIPANIGLSAASRDGVFFVDGDDWLEPGGFLACRAAFDATAPDILIGNYLEHNDQTGQFKRPSDLDRWAAVSQMQGDLQAERKLALSMIAVPWRKFYRRDFPKAITFLKTTHSIGRSAARHGPSAFMTGCCVATAPTDLARPWPRPVSNSWPSLTISKRLLVS